MVTLGRLCFPAMVRLACPTDEDLPREASFLSSARSLADFSDRPEDLSLALSAFDRS